MSLRTISLLIAAAFGLLTIAPAPLHAQMLAGLAIDGIRCDVTEGAVEHVHTHLQIIDRGHSTTIPGQIGIPEGAGCLYWVHTHSDDGVIHIEAPVKKTFTLGEFFDIWEAPLDREHADGVQAARGKSLRVTVNGRVWTQDPRLIPLRNREEIIIQNGPPYVSGHPADWSKF